MYFRCIRYIRMLNCYGNASGEHEDCLPMVKVFTNPSFYLKNILGYL